MHHGINTRVGTVSLIDQQNHGKFRGKRFTQDKASLRKRALTGIDQQHHTIDHAQAAFHFATKISVARRIDHVYRDVRSPSVNTAVGHRGVLRENRDAFFFFQIP